MKKKSQKVFHIVKFRLSVVFTKTQLEPSFPISWIKKAYYELFKEEVEEELLLEILGDIITDNIDYYTEFNAEKPEDFELNDL